MIVRAQGYINIWKVKRDARSNPISVQFRVRIFSIPLVFGGWGGGRLHIVVSYRY